MAKLNWSKNRPSFSDPGRAVEVGDYGILSDDKAGRKGNVIKKKVKKKTLFSMAERAIVSVDRAFPNARDGRAKPTKAGGKQVKVEIAAQKEIGSKRDGDRNATDSLDNLITSAKTRYQVAVKSVERAKASLRNSQSELTLSRVALERLYKLKKTS